MNEGARWALISMLFTCQSSAQPQDNIGYLKSLNIVVVVLQNTTVTYCSEALTMKMVLIENKTD